MGVFKYEACLFTSAAVSRCGVSLFGSRPRLRSEPTLSSYTEPSQSGLSAIQPYPNANSVCQRIREHDAIREATDDGSILIACPKHETNAIKDQVDLGADILAHALHWSILVVPTPE